MTCDNCEYKYTCTKHQMYDEYYDKVTFVEYTDETCDSFKSDDECKIDTIKDINSWKLITEEFPPILPKVYRRSNYTYRNTERMLLVVDQTNGTRMVKEGYAEVYDDGAVCWKIPGTIKEVTHWMPMPELPEPVEWVHSYVSIGRDKTTHLVASLTCENCGYIETNHFQYLKCPKCNALWDKVREEVK